MKAARLFIIALGFAAFTPGHASALTTAVQEGDYADVRLFTTHNAVGDAKAITGGVEIKMEPGWYAYWRMPGEGGLAPKLNWEGSSNIGPVKLSWPVPERIETMGLQSFGYKQDTILRFEAPVTEAGKDVTLKLKADIMVCKDICVPQHFEFSLNIPASVGEEITAADEIKLLESHDARMPMTKDGPGLKIESTVIGPQAIVLRTWSAKGYENADIFVELGDNSLYLVAPPQITPDEKDGRYATVRIPAPEGADNLADVTAGKAVTITFKTPHGALEKTIQF